MQRSNSSVVGYVHWCSSNDISQQAGTSEVIQPLLCMNTPLYQQFHCLFWAIGARIMQRSTSIIKIYQVYIYTSIQQFSNSLQIVDLGGLEDLVLWANRHLSNRNRLKCSSKLLRTTKTKVQTGDQIANVNWKRGRPLGFGMCTFRAWVLLDFCFVKRCMLEGMFPDITTLRA